MTVREIILIYEKDQQKKFEMASRHVVFTYDDMVFFVFRSSYSDLYSVIT